MAKQKETPEIIQAPTKFNIRLDDKIYTVNFGTNTFIRIREDRPLLPSAFHVLDEIEAYEAIPFLIYIAIDPKERDWTSFEEFLDAYDNCDDPEINKVTPAYLSAVGALAKKLTPAMEAVKKFQEAGTK